jgi:putative flippase GtrA
MAESWLKRSKRRNQAASLLRRLGWLSTLALAGVWIGVGFIPDLPSNWVWFSRAAIFFIGAAVIWFAYDPSEDRGA